MIKVLWISPNLNHYKARFLNRLTKSDALNLTVLAGGQVEKLGHRQDQSDESFFRINVNATKGNFQASPSVYWVLLRQLKKHKFDVILMPMEKKLSLLIVYLAFLKNFFKFKLVSYNHTSTRGFDGKLDLDTKITKFLFSLYDRVIFYTQEAMNSAVNSNLLQTKKAYFASNTLNTDEIWSHYNFEINHSEEKAILFIGRLTANKRLDLLFKYYTELKKRIPCLRLVIIGDGPEASKVKSVVDKDDSISWQGAIVDEKIIAIHMRSIHFVFVPGESGLSIVHAFCYGKPYVTTTMVNHHGPELAYLKNGENGIILEGNIDSDCQRILRLLNDPEAYAQACRAAYKKARMLSIGNWCLSMEKALIV